MTRERNENVKTALLTGEALELLRTRHADSDLTLLGRAVAFLALVALLSAAAGVASSESPSPLAGSWELAASAEEEQQRLRAIDEATKNLRAMQRGRARDMLAGRTAPPQSIKISLEGSTVTIGSGGRDVELELGGPPIEASGDQGTAQLSARMEGDELIVVADAGKGGRTTAYSADGDRLSVEVTMTGARLAEPLNYVSTYERVE